MMNVTFLPASYNKFGTTIYTVQFMNNIGQTVEAIQVLGGANGTWVFLNVSDPSWTIDASNNNHNIYSSTGLPNGQTLTTTMLWTPIYTPYFVNTEIDSFSDPGYNTQIDTVYVDGSSFPLRTPFNQQGDYTSLSSYITTNLLANLTTIDLANIFDNELTDLAGFPAATVTAQELQGRVLDNTRNERIRRFTIRIFIDRNIQNFGASTAEQILRSVADELTLKIDANPTMGGNCIDTKPFPAQFGYINRESNNIRVMQIQLDCRDAVTWR